LITIEADRAAVVARHTLGSLAGEPDLLTGHASYLTAHLPASISSYLTERIKADPRIEKPAPPAT
jgi:hypothetical protein